MSRREARLDRDVAALLAARAFTEIRYVAGDVRRTSEDGSPDEDLERIRFLADLCHNMPGIARPRRPWQPSRRGTRGSTPQRAMMERPMGWTWHTTGQGGREWMLRHIERDGLRCDGEQVTGMLAVLPDTFTALPSAVQRRQQLRLVHLARATERDTYLWGRDHKAECDPQRCGYTPEAASE